MTIMIGLTFGRLGKKTLRYEYSAGNQDFLLSPNCCESFFRSFERWIDCLRLSNEREVNTQA